ncbi:hypothetical protein BDR07DRAFT_1481540 [Suillus spraguei]|nr:hypothetical protein BDR07DRAFT_1481540 [Suillus spraguei]
MLASHFAGLLHTTQQMNMPHTTTLPAPKLYPSTLSSSKTPASVLNKLKTSSGGFYAGTPRLAHHAEYFAGGRDGNILITKGLEYDEEFIICEAFKFSSEDFPTVLSNLSAFESLVPKERHYETVSAIHDAIGRRSIKLTHHLFEANDKAQGGTSDEDGNILTTVSLSSKFDILTFADRHKGHLQDVAFKHNICPLLAYDQNHILIPPLQYEAKLKGTLVEVHMASYHHHTKKSKHDIFEAVLRELIVLSPPVPMPRSPFKRRHLNDGPCTEQHHKGNNWCA